MRSTFPNFESPSANRRRDADAGLDAKVRAAYGMNEQEDPPGFLLRLNLDLADKGAKGQSITPTGLPAFITGGPAFVTHDCIQVS